MREDEIKKIYFDMDGVLADFDRGVRELCGLDPIDQAQKTEQQDDEMFARMREVEHFYDELEPKPGALELFRKLYEKYGDKCEILSGIPKPKRGIVNAKEDKIAWSHRLLNKELVVNIVYRAEKKNYCTGSDCILIDDLKKNIDEWEEMGGIGVWFTGVEEGTKKLQELGIL